MEQLNSSLKCKIVTCKYFQILPIITWSAQTKVVVTAVQGSASALMDMMVLLVKELPVRVTQILALVMEFASPLSN